MSQRRRPLSPWISHIDLVQEVDALMTKVEELKKDLAFLAEQASKGIATTADGAAVGIEGVFQITEKLGQRIDILEKMLASVAQQAEDGLKMGFEGTIAIVDDFESRIKALEENR